MPISFVLHEVLQEKYYIHTTSGALKARITIEKAHGNDKPLLSHMKPEKATTIIYQIPSGTTMSQPQLIINLPIRKGLKRQV